MTRRTVTIRLDPQCESPATREFKNNPVEEVSKKRGDYVSFALVIVRAWIVAGRPMATVKPLNSYSQWSDLCRQPLLWLGLKDPAQCVFNGMAHDPDREFLGRFLSIWHEVFNTKSATVKNLIEQSVSDTAVREIVNDIAQQRDGSVSGQKLGL
jgi:putative DNA primase/helicase